MTALEGILIIDSSQLLPGSLCTQMLADLGARVIKIEGMKGDGFRQSTPLVGASGSYFQILNRNKLGMCLNLKELEGRSVMKEIVSKADVFLESCRPGTMDDLGLGYDDFKKLNPRLIYCSLTGFGQDGPYRDKAAHDINLAALAGILELLGGRQAARTFDPDWRRRRREPYCRYRDTGRAARKNADRERAIPRRSHPGRLDSLHVPGNVAAPGGRRTEPGGKKQLKGRICLVQYLSDKR